MPQKVEISYKTIIFSTVFVLFLWFLYQIRDILLLFFIAVILMGALNPTITRLERWRIPRWLGIVLVYFLLLGLLTGAIGGLIPPLVDQTGRLIELAVTASSNLSFLGVSPEKITSQLQELGGLPTQILKLAVSLFSNIVSVFAVLVMCFYLLLGHKNLNKYLSFLFGLGGRSKAKRIIGMVEIKLGGWVRGEFFLMTIIGVLNYLGFRILGLKYALPLAILAGILEIIPNIGPTVAAVPAILVGLLESPLTALLVAIWAFLVQQLENSLIVPKVMQRSIGVNPLVTILSLAVGFKIAGVTGAILAVPFYLLLETIFSELFSTSVKRRLEPRGK